MKAKLLMNFNGVVSKNKISCKLLPFSFQARLTKEAEYERNQTSYIEPITVPDPDFDEIWHRGGFWAKTRPRQIFFGF